MTALTRRHVLAGAAATVAAAALPAVADEFAPNSVKMFDAAVAHPDSYLIMNGIGILSMEFPS
jgi:hypothetical protein